MPIPQQNIAAINGSHSSFVYRIEFCPISGKVSNPFEHEFEYESQTDSQVTTFVVNGIANGRAWKLNLEGLPANSYEFSMPGGVHALHVPICKTFPQAEVICAQGEL